MNVIRNHFPLWKNIMLCLLVCVGLIYALPNLYSEDPVVQVSSTQAVDVQVLQQTLSALLKKSNLSYEAIDLQSKGCEIRFVSTDAQLMAFDLLKHQFSEPYTVALNLAPATPLWMRKLGAEPMKQGLDLRGGVHFLLQVDSDSVIHRREEGLMKGVGQALRDVSIRYAGIKRVPSGVEVLFRTEQDRDAAVTELKDKFQSMIVAALPAKSPALSALLLTMPEAEINRIRQITVEQTMSILRNRVNELGIGEAIVQQQGMDRIAVDLPGIQDAAHAKQILGGTATLEFHLVDPEHDPIAIKASGIVPMESKLYIAEGGQPLLLKRQVVLSGDAVTSAMSSFDTQTASPAVHIELGGGGERFFTKVTRDNIGKRMAIVFVETKVSAEKVNGVDERRSRRVERVISAPVIQTALGNSFQITGLKDATEAANLSLLLRAGALPAAIYPIEELTVGPSLGKENIRRGLISLEVGMGLILIVMLVYYRFFGLVADLALFLNLILLAALMSLLGATLTLPGIAGFVLTVGMAVDANVLINERIREELRLGMTPQVAIQLGYARAFSTIMDSNVTTLIVGIILFAIGTGPVKGFAVILCLGLLTSMLTSITYTRAIVNLVYGNRDVKKLSIGI